MYTAVYMCGVITCHGSTAQQQSAFTLEAGPTRETTAFAGPGWASPEKRSRPAHGWKGRPRNWQRSARWYQVHTYVVHNTYPTMKPRHFFHTKTNISRTHAHTRRLFSGDASIRNSLRSNNLDVRLVRFRVRAYEFLFERSEFLIDTFQKKICLCVRLILVLVWKKLILVLVWGTYYVPDTYVPRISRPYTARSFTGRGMLVVRGLPLRVGGRPMRHVRWEYNKNMC